MSQGRQRPLAIRPDPLTVNQCLFLSMQQKRANFRKGVSLTQSMQCGRRKRHRLACEKCSMPTLPTVSSQKKKQSRWMRLSVMWYRNFRLENNCHLPLKRHPNTFREVDNDALCGDTGREIGMIVKIMI